MTVHAIKRYANRKLYDATDRRYVTLDELAALVRDGHQVEVTDNETGEDITGATLAQVIVEQQRKRSWPLSEELLHELIRSPAGALGRLFEGGASVARSAGQKGEQLIRQWMPGAAPPGAAPPGATPPGAPPGPGAEADAVEDTPSFRARVAERVDESVRRVLDGLGVVTRSELDRVLGALGELKAKLEALESRRPGGSGRE